MDVLSPAERSELMGRIRAKDTQPERVVRRLVQGMGYRYRLHSPRLPGKPDLAFPGRKKALFVHGCFWHAHPGCRRAFSPKTRPEYWESKLRTNRERDARACGELGRLGWSWIVVWECEVNEPSLADRLSRFLGAARTSRRGPDALRDKR
jgi:DNA mismatch endonuclease (patch repair protein)